MKQGMKHKTLLKSIAGLTAVFALAVGAEWNGYRVFDSKDGRNPICTLDPTCRSLTEGEIDMARAVFGEAIDYRKVKLFHRNYMVFLDQSDNAMTPNGNMYFSKASVWSKDFSLEDSGTRKFLMHELTHAWQYQTGKTIPTEALDNYVSYDFDYWSSYKYALNDHKLFSDFNIEQQASMIENYVEKRYDLAEMLDSQMAEGATGDNAATRSFKAANCTTLKALEDKIGQVLPLQRETACPELPPPPRHKRPRLHRLAR